MKINNTTRIILTCLLIFVGLFVNPSDHTLESNGWLLAKIAATWIMLTHGTFVDRRYFFLAYVIGFAAEVGVAFKILHYAGADELLAVSLPAMTVLYFIHFLSKKQKQLLDILKVLTVSLQFTIAWLVMMHWMESHTWVSLLPEYSFWITFAYYIVLGIQRKTLYV
ncbi:hypothetical protein SAMN04488109_1702 [Chryseolinea serpens]|uniref:YhhN-like protein n=1 Tax=Chryseolinea serpens TaxID=947013 RepID=A0A1M5MEM8_9BACT|nr:hypothetical protein [Chryseolinea serpens]SHG75622.1 hypothetical protein SAMN04488109_1702 [Chryseolinea serpens]